MPLSRREFLGTTGGALAGAALVPQLMRAAVPGADPHSGALAHSAPLASRGSVERVRSFRDGVLRPTAWLRQGGTQRLALLDDARLEIRSPLRGREVHDRIGLSLRGAIDRDFGADVLREVLEEMRRG